MHLSSIMIDKEEKMISVRSCGLTLGIFGGVAMFILAWWLILTGNAEGPTTLFERVYIGYSFTPLVSIIGAVWGFVDWGIHLILALGVYIKIFFLMI